MSLFDIRWSHLMFEESEAVIQTMLALQRNDIPSLPVRDMIHAVVPQKRRFTKLSLS